MCRRRRAQAPRKPASERLCTASPDCSLPCESAGQEGRETSRPPFVTIQKRECSVLIRDSCSRVVRQLGWIGGEESSTFPLSDTMSHACVPPPFSAWGMYASARSSLGKASKASQGLGKEIRSRTSRYKTSPFSPPSHQPSQSSANPSDTDRLPHLTALTHKHAHSSYHHWLAHGSCRPVRRGSRHPGGESSRAAHAGIN